MKNLLKNPFFYTSIASLLALGLIIGFYVFGWTGPTAAPPNNNVTLSSGALPAGSAGYVQFASSSTTFGGDAGLFWDNTNKRLGIGTTTPSEKLEVSGNIKLSGATPTYTIKNIIAPVNASDAATKGYVDAASSGSLLSVYKADNTTWVGYYLGYTGTPNYQYGWIIAHPTYGVLTVTPNIHSTTLSSLYYAGNNCTGSARQASSNQSYSITDGVKVCGGSGSGLVNANSIRYTNGYCTDLSNTWTNRYACNTTNDELCGLGNCIIRP